MPEVAVAYIFPGQGSFPKRSLLENSTNQPIMDRVRQALPPSKDIEEIYTNIRNPDYLTSENMHILLASAAAIAHERLRPHLKGQSIAISGHSAGLTTSLLALTDFRQDEVEGIVETMLTRGKALDKAEKNSPTNVFAVEWQGNAGFHTLADWVLHQNEDRKTQDNKYGDLWVACFNFENNKKAQVVITVREGYDLEKNLREQFTDKIGKITKLLVHAPAHSPLSIGAAFDYYNYLKRQGLIGRVQQIKDSGVVYVSDHIAPKNQNPLVSNDTDEIIEDLVLFHLPVEFQRTIEYMIKELKVQKFVEIGSNTLTNLLKGMGIPDSQVCTITTPQELDALETELANRAV